MKKIIQNIFSIKNSDNKKHKIITFLGVKIKVKSKKLENKAIKITLDELLTIRDSGVYIVYFDHSLGGGTETYFYNQLSDLSDNDILYRIQYFFKEKSYKITVYTQKNIYEANDISFLLLSKFLYKLKFDKIILNNIVGYNHVKNILDLISDYKKSSPLTEVIMKGHDFYSICPEWNLLNYNNEYCGIETKDCECKKCFNKFQLKCNDIQRDFSITFWRNLWGNFFDNTVDIIEVFSPSSKNIFLKAYPKIKDKILLNPHKIKPFPKYRIGVLGAFCIHKGSKIIESLIEYFKDNKTYEYSIYIIGEVGYNINSDLCFYAGKYDRNNLPNVLKNNNIDLILIPSICHETFSYTTAEAITLGYPVACFDMGGQADQVKQYDKGLILSSFEPEIIEKEIRDFLENGVNI